MRPSRAKVHIVPLLSPRSFPIFVLVSIAYFSFVHVDSYLTITYKTEVSNNPKRKLEMIEVELQKLTAAITALVEVLQNPPKFAVELEAKEESKADRNDRINREDDAARHAMQAERDQKLADLYKAEQAKAKRKAKVTTEETKALVEAVVAPAEPVGEPSVPDQPIKDNIPEGRPDITETSLKTMALEIVRADSSARDKVLELLAEYGVKTFVQLSPKHHHEAHAKLSAIAAEVGSI
jgi:hypothetical protein